MNKNAEWKIETCKICGKTFIPTYKYVYKLKKYNKGYLQTKYYCSYTCWRKDGGGESGNIHGVGKRR